MIKYLNGFVRDDALRLATQPAISGYVSLMVDPVALETKERKRLRAEP